MPDTTTLLMGLVFGSIGFGYFIYGKKQSALMFRYTGIALMVYPYFVANRWATLAVGIALMAVPKFVDL